MRSSWQLDPLHQHRVAPAAVGRALGGLQDAHPAEAGLLVGPDRRRVLQRRVDREAVVAEIVEQMARHRPHDVRSHAPAVDARIEEQVDPRVAVVRGRLLAVLDHADDAVVEQHRVPGGLGLLVGEVRLEVVPEGVDLRGQADGAQRRRVLRRERPQDDEVSVQSALAGAAHAPTVADVGGDVRSHRHCKSSPGRGGWMALRIMRRRAQGGPRRSRVLIAVVAAACLSGIAASTASASFIYIRGDHTETDYVYAGLDGVGEVNRVTVTQFVSGGTTYYNFVENGGGAITDFDANCQRSAFNAVFCPVVVDGFPYNADAELHDGDDTITMSTTRPAEIDGGTGSDVLKGGSAADNISGNGDGAGTDGDDVIDGRGGADVMSGGGGTDTVSYASRSTAVNVSLDGAANDGGSGEGDQVGSDVESISGSQGPDTLTGNDVVNVLDGNGGIDIIDGLG